MKHISEYSRSEILKCLAEGGFQISPSASTEVLRSLLSMAIKSGDAPTIEELR